MSDLLDGPDSESSAVEIDHATEQLGRAMSLQDRLVQLERLDARKADGSLLDSPKLKSTRLGLPLKPTVPTLSPMTKSRRLAATMPKPSDRRTPAKVPSSSIFVLLFRDIGMFFSRKSFLTFE